MKALLPLSWLYAAGVAVDRRARMAPKKSAGDAPRVISIGNLEAGGNGKTPLAIWWLSRAIADGAKIAYVSRGYGGASVSAGVVSCVLPSDMAPPNPAGLRLLDRAHPGLEREIGDEGALVAERVPGAPALFCRDKRRAVAVAASLGVDHVLLDDAFQSWRVPRHVDIVLLDAEHPLDDGQLLPAGRLRERPQAIRRADALVFNGAASTSGLQNARARVQPWIRDGVPVAGMARTVTLVASDGRADAPPGRVVAVSAIARPHEFARSLKRAGVEVAAEVVFRDHHRYEARDVARMVQCAREQQADLVTTEKDWVKLRRFEVQERVWVARLDVALIGDPLPV